MGFYTGVSPKFEDADFTVLKEVIHTYKGRYRKEKLLALQRLYQFVRSNK